MDIPRLKLARAIIDEEVKEHEELAISSSRKHSTRCSPSHNTVTPRKEAEAEAEQAPWLRHRHRPRPTSSLLLLIFLIISCCTSLSSASHFYIHEQMVEEDASEDMRTALARLAKSGTVLVDEGPPPNPKAWTLATEHDDLQRRGVDDPSSSFPPPSSSSLSQHHVTGSTVSSKSPMITTASTSSRPSSTSSSSVMVAATTQASPSPLPTPLDIGFSGNITDSCQSFMDSMLNNATFKSCLPFSLLLQNSNSFFQDSKSLVRITQVLDATCAADISTCSPIMADLASNITTSSHCASDLASQNPIITYAHQGLLAYKPLYTASCLRNPSTSSYCYADAVTNASSPTDSYIYYLPLNNSLPGGAQPTCDACLQNTMAVFEAASSNRDSALATDYVSAAMQVNVQCGPGFVNQSLATAVVSAGVVETVNPGVGLLALALLAGRWLLL